MFMVIPQFQVRFALGDTDYAWIVNGEEMLDTLCEILRWNGVTSYAVTPFDYDKGDPLVEGNSKKPK